MYFLYRDFILGGDFGRPAHFTAADAQAWPQHRDRDGSALFAGNTHLLLLCSVLYCQRHGVLYTSVDDVPISVPGMCHIHIVSV